LVQTSQFRGFFGFRGSFGVEEFFRGDTSAGVAAGVRPFRE
jgi:hypothetical protein